MNIDSSRPSNPENLSIGSLSKEGHARFVERADERSRHENLSASCRQTLLQASETDKCNTPIMERKVDCIKRGTFLSKVFVLAALAAVVFKGMIPSQTRIQQNPILLGHPSCSANHSWLDVNSAPFSFVLPSNATSESIHLLVNEGGLLYHPLTLDRGDTKDQCLVEPSRCLLSLAKDLHQVDRSTPVILLVHGFTASTYEWNDFAAYIDENANGSVRYSKILLGGHGHSYGEFKKSDWKKWGQPILDEYKALVALGFTNISLTGSSTGCTLIIEQLSQGAYSQTQVAPKNIFLIDPMLEEQSFVDNAIVRMGALLRLSYGPTQAFTPEEFAYWYVDRPFTALQSLNELVQKAKGALTTSIDLPPHTHLVVWASQGDPTVDAEGYKQIKKGIMPSEGGSVCAEPVSSSLHVFTRLSGRPWAASEGQRCPSRENVKEQVKTAPIAFTAQDQKLQRTTFDKILNRCL